MRKKYTAFPIFVANIHFYIGEFYVVQKTEILKFSRYVLMFGLNNITGTTWNNSEIFTIYIIFNHYSIFLFLFEAFEAKIHTPKGKLTRSKINLKIIRIV